MVMSRKPGRPSRQRSNIGKTMRASTGRGFLAIPLTKVLEAGKGQWGHTMPVKGFKESSQQTQLSTNTMKFSYIGKIYWNKLIVVGIIYLV